MGLTDRQYLDAMASMFGGPDETRIECRTTKIVRVRLDHPCACPSHIHNETDHCVLLGTRAVRDKAIADGKWGACYVCLTCLESWWRHCEKGSVWCGVE